MLSIVIERNLSADTSGAAGAWDRREQLVILVIGGRSRIGSALIDSLCARGREVRALVRAMEPVAAFAATVECSGRRSGFTWSGGPHLDRRCRADVIGPSSSALTARLLFLPVTARSLLLAFLLAIPMTNLVIPVTTRLFVLWLFSGRRQRRPANNPIPYEEEYAR
ncbi:MAG: hypothetical protein ABSG43_23765 [Solirubrobacteraceae bacterium]